jgi:hypothetical protein
MSYTEKHRTAAIAANALFDKWRKTKNHEDYLAYENALPRVAFLQGKAEQERKRSCRP